MKCPNCDGPMKLIGNLPASLGIDLNIYACYNCDTTEKITTKSKAWLYVNSKELQAPK